MSSMFEQLWPAFVEEVTEQLETLELELLKQNIEEVDIRKVFRQFHTIKSSCGMLEFNSMEILAHLSEDILGEIRNGNAELSTALIAVFIEALDALKSQMKEAEKSKSAPERNPSVENKLKAVLAGINGEDASLDASEEDSQEADELDNQAELRHASHDVKIDNGQSLEASPEVVALSQIVRDHLENIVIKKNKNNLARIIESISQLREAGEALGYRSISGLLVKLENEYLSENTNHYAIVTYMSDLLARLETLENSFSIDLGCKSARDKVKGLYKKDFIKEMNIYLTRLEEIFQINNDNEKVEAWGKEAMNYTFYLINYSRLFSIEPFTEYMNFSYQLLKKYIYQGDGYDDIRGLVTNIESALKDNDFEINSERFSGYTDQFVDKSNNDNASNLKTDTWDFLTKETLIDWTKYITAEKITEIKNSYLEKSAIREIFIDFEANKVLVEEFVSWLYDNLSVVTNVSVFDDESLSLPLDATVGFLALDENPHTNDYQLQQYAAYSEMVFIKSYHHSNPDLNAKKSQTKSINNDQSTLRVSSQNLDKFVSQMGELVMARNSLAHVIHNDAVALDLYKLKSWIRESGNAISADSKSLLNTIVENFTAYRENLVKGDNVFQSTLSRMQDEVLNLRVVPMSTIFNRLPRLVHGLNRDLGKKVVLEVSGEAEKIDKGLVDILMEPMLHLIRNAMDHGIETPDVRKAAGKDENGLILVKASTEGNTLTITVEDNGAGLDKEKILAKAKKMGLKYSEHRPEDLIFESGFSTSDVLTETSGRGVGMDAVKTSITSIGGNVLVESTKGKGTRFILHVPVSVAIQGVVLIESEQHKFAVPERNIEEVVEYRLSDIQQVDGQASFLLRDSVLPLFNLNKLIFPSEDASPVVNDGGSFLVLSNGKHKIALAVSNIIGRNEIFVRDVNPELLKIPGFGGASVLGDGNVVIILDCDSLISLASQNGQNMVEFFGEQLQ